MTTLLDLLWSLAAVGLSLYLGLSLTRKDPGKRPAAALPLWFFAAAGHWALQQTGAPVLLYLPAGAVLAGALRLTFCASWLYAGAAAMLSFIALEAAELLRLSGVPFLIVLAVLALLAVFAWQGAALLPEESGVVPTGEQRKAVHFNLHMGSSLAALAAVQLWLWGLLTVGGSFTPGPLWVVLAASATLCGLLLLFVRFVTFGTMERIEAVVDKQYQAELLNLMQVIRAQRHDFNIHIQSLAGMLEQGSLEECRTYLTQML